MAVIVIDRDLLIDAPRGRSPARERTRIETLLAAFAILPFDSEAANEAGEIRRRLEANGTPIGMADYLIAGTVRSRGGLLVTGNRKHFERVERLSLGLYEKPPPERKS